MSVVGNYDGGVEPRVCTTMLTSHESVEEAFGMGPSSAPDPSGVAG
jgi:hypothetical protein